MKRIKSIFTASKPAARETKLKTEEEYYRQLFIENPQWNQPDPNEEELVRWRIIEKFIYYIKGFRQASQPGSELKILDLGCGRGWLSNLMSRHGKVTAVEPVSEVAKYAKQLFPGLSVQPGTADTLLSAGRAAEFDLLVCSEVIEHVPDADKPGFVEKINRLTSAGGFVIITTPRKEVQETWMKHCSPDQPVEEWMDESSLKNIFDNQGFTSLLLDRFSAKPVPSGPDIEIYQLWLFQKK